VEKVNLSNDHQCVQPPLTNVLGALRALPAPQVSAQFCKNLNSKRNCKNFRIMELQELVLQDETSTNLQGEWDIFGFEVWKNFPFQRLSLSSDPRSYLVYKKSSHFWNNVQSIDRFVMSNPTHHSRDLQCVPGPGEGLRGHRLKHWTIEINIAQCSKCYREKPQEPVQTNLADLLFEYR